MNRDMRKPRPKRIPLSRRKIERNVRSIESDISDDFSDSSCEYMTEGVAAQYSDDSDSDVEIIGNSLQNEHTPADRSTIPTIDNGVRWQEEETDMFNFPLAKQNELLVRVEGEGSPLDYFALLFDDSLMQLIVNETNRYAETEFLRVGSAPRSRIAQWKPTDKEEILTFIALIIHTGTIKVNRLTDYWKKHHLFNMSCFSNYMSRDRFLLLLRCLNFAPNIETTDDDRELLQPANDRLYKIKPLITYFNDKMNAIYYPSKELLLGESMVLWGNRLLCHQQCTQNECHKYGIKLYMLTEPCGMILKCAVYTGVFNDLGGKRHAANVVLHLMSEKLNNGHSLYMGSFYNSFYLATKLIQERTFCTGTLRVNMINVPMDVVMAKLKKYDTIARYSQGVMIGKWKDKREVAYISTEFKNNVVLSANKNGKKQVKPEPIENINRFMCDTDNRDEMQSYYPFSMNTIRWYKKIGIHVIQMLLMNSFYLYNQYHVGPKITLYDYRLSILSELLPILPKPRTFISSAASKTYHFPEKYEVGKNGRTARKRCHLCYSNGIRRDTSYFCPNCPKQPSLCLEPCFKIFHPN